MKLFPKKKHNFNFNLQKKIYNNNNSYVTKRKK